MKKQFILILFSTLSFTCFPQGNFNLFELTLNDSLLKELNIEELTDHLGRPSLINKNELISEYAGPRVYYHNFGLDIWFRPKNKDPQQRIDFITIYLIKKWDDVNKQFFNPFPGSFIPNLNSELKFNDIINIFSDYEIEIFMAEKRRKQLEDSSLNSDDIEHDIIVVDINSFKVNFYFEELTKFLDRVSIRLVSFENR